MINRTSRWPSNSVPRYVPKRKKTHGHTKKTMCTFFIAAVFLIAKKWKQSHCLPTDEWINKMWYIHTMEYYEAIKSATQIYVIT